MVDYQGRKLYADLLPDGTFAFCGLYFVSPAALALHMKRTVNPGILIRIDVIDMYRIDLKIFKQV